MTETFEMIATKSTGEATTVSSTSVSNILLDVDNNKYSTSTTVTSSGVTSSATSMKFYSNTLHYNDGTGTWVTLTKADESTYGLTDDYFAASTAKTMFNLIPFAADSTMTMYDEKTIDGKQVYCYTITPSAADKTTHLKNLNDTFDKTFTGLNATTTFKNVSFDMQVNKDDSTIRSITMSYDLSITITGGTISITGATVTQNFNSINMPVVISPVN